MLSTNKHLDVKIDDYTIGYRKYEKLLGVKIDVNLIFDNHISNLCKKAGRKISSLARVFSLMSFHAYPGAERNFVGSIS